MRGVRSLVVLLTVAGCGNAAPECSHTNDNGVLEQDPQSALLDPQTDLFAWDTQEHRDERKACKVPMNKIPAEVMGNYPDKDLKAKIKHVIVILRENRSFDHYLGSLRPQHIPLPDNQTNPDPKPDDAGVRGKDVVRFPSKQWCTPAGPDHEWTASHLQYNHGKLDGFVAASGDHTPMGYFSEEDLRFYYWLANNFAVNESYHASLLGPTMANISFYYNATSCGSTENTETTDLMKNPFVSKCAQGNSIFSRLKKKGVNYRVYNDGPHRFDIAAPDSGAVGLTEYPVGDLRTIQDFRDDVAKEEAGGEELPPVIFIEPDYGHIQALIKKYLGLDVGEPQNDEHPPSNITFGQHFVWDIINTLLSPPERKVFSHSVVFITWDENGGFYDHVAPPPACEPDDQAPCDFKFDRYGFRVPFFAISPYSRKGFASHYTADHTSILRFIEAWQDLTPLTKRDANAWPLFDMFDFRTARDEAEIEVPAEPVVLPCPSVDTP